MWDGAVCSMVYRRRVVAWRIYMHPKLAPFLLDRRALLQDTAMPRAPQSKVRLTWEPLSFWIEFGSFRGPLNAALIRNHNRPENSLSPSAEVFASSFAPLFLELPMAKINTERAPNSL
jgi:hypothetical protein